MTNETKKAVVVGRMNIITITAEDMGLKPHHCRKGAGYGDESVYLLPFTGEDALKKSLALWLQTATVMAERFEEAKRIGGQFGFVGEVCSHAGRTIVSIIRAEGLCCWVNETTGGSFAESYKGN